MPQTNKIKFRRGLETNLPAGGTEAGEPRYSIDSKKLYIDDGTNNVKVGGNPANFPVSTPQQIALNQKAMSPMYANEIFDNFLGTASPFTGGFQANNAGGSLTSTQVDGKTGILVMNTGTSVTINRTAVINTSTSTTVSLFGSTGIKRYVCNWARNGAQWFDGTTTGNFSCGFMSNFGTNSPQSAIMFRAQDGGNIFAVTRKGGVETAVDCGSNGFPTAGVYNTYDIQINSAGTSVDFYINGIFQTTINTNIPNTAGSGLGIGMMILRTVITGTAVLANADWHYLKIDHPVQPLF